MEITMIYYESTAKTRVIDSSMSIKDLFVMKGQPIDCVIGILDGFHGKFINHISEKYYYILEGSAKIMINDEEFTIGVGDFVHIPKETSHSICGKIKFAIICSPAFDFNTEEVLD